MPDEMTLEIANAIRKNSHALTGASSDYDALIQQVGDARFVLLGEASHGTHEFYRARAQITRRLIKEKNFNAVAVEADCSSCADAQPTMPDATDAWLRT